MSEGKINKDNDGVMAPKDTEKEKALEAARQKAKEKYVQARSSMRARVEEARNVSAVIQRQLEVGPRLRMELRKRKKTVALEQVVDEHLEVSTKFLESAEKFEAADEKCKESTEELTAALEELDKLEESFNDK